MDENINAMRKKYIFITEMEISCFEHAKTMDFKLYFNKIHYFEENDGKCTGCISNKNQSVYEIVLLTTYNLVINTNGYNFIMCRNCFELVCDNFKKHFIKV